MKLRVLILFFLLSSPISALAGDGATLLFKEGQVAYISNGYSALVQEYKRLEGKNATHKIVELNLESSSFLINIAEIVLICRDRCTSLEVNDPRKSSQREK